MKKIFVGCLPFRITDQEIKKLFLPYGPVKSVELFRDLENARFHSYAYVYMDTDDIDAAIKGLDGKQICMKYLRVNEAVDRQG